MKFTNEDLMKAMGLQVGDKIKIDLGYTFEIVQNGKIISLERLGEGYYTDLEFLVDTDFEILPRPKRVGQLTCREIKDCRTCPLWWICFIKIQAKDEMETSLYEMLESFVVTDQEIHDLLKARLDKEVVEEYEKLD